MFTNRIRSGLPQVVVFYNQSGGGHVNAARVLDELFVDAYSLRFVNFSKEFVDQAMSLSGKTRSTRDPDWFYNYCLARGQHRVVNVWAKWIVPGVIRTISQRIVSMLCDYLKREQIDLIVSVVPVVNAPIARAAKKLGIPLLIATTEGDLRYWQIGLKNFRYDKMRFTVGENYPWAQKDLLEAGLPKSQLLTAGLPIRKEFLQTNLRGSIENIQFRRGEFVVMVLCGASGGLRLMTLLKQLLTLSSPLHVLACIGRSEFLSDSISALELPKHIRLSIIGYTDQIAALMARSDLLITKPGPGTIHEAMTVGLPMIVDASATLLRQEERYPDFVKTHGLGLVLDDINDLGALVNLVMNDADLYRSMKNAFQNFKKENFHDNFIRIVEDMLAAPSAEG